MLREYKDRRTSLKLIGGFMRKNKLQILTICAAVVLLLCLVPQGRAYAEGASAISFGTIDYEALTMQVYNNNNTVVYYSTDNSTWSEIEGGYNSALKAYVMDISWVSASADVTLYFKGDTVKTVKTMLLPAQNSSISVEYDRVEGEFTFSDVDEASNFEWRKTLDYYWNTVSLNENSASYRSFMATMESMRTKGAKIIIRTPQEIGTGAGNPGMRPSSEITITIPARAAAPSVKVNIAKLTLNTTTSLEYYDAASNLWMECDASMSVEDIAPKVLYENGGASVTLQIRKAATSSTPYSKIQRLTIPGQAAAPTIGGNNSDVTYYYLNSKLVMQFNNASASNLYEYIVVKESATFSMTSTGWKTVNSSSLMTLSNSLAPKGCTIYVRRKGIEENTAKNTPLVLPSAVNSFSVTY